MDRVDCAVILGFATMCTLLLICLGLGASVRNDKDKIQLETYRICMAYSADNSKCEAPK